MTRKLTIEQANRLRNDFECWQQDYDPKDDKEQYDMFGRGMAAMDMLIAGMYQEPVAWRWRSGPDTRWHLASSGDLAGEVEPLYRHAQQPVVDIEPTQMFGIGSIFKPQVVSEQEADCDDCAHYNPKICHGEGCPAISQQSAQPAPVVMDIDELRLAFEEKERESDDGFNLHKYGIGYADDATQGRWEQWLECRAAMLQAGTLTNKDTRQVDELTMWIKRLVRSLKNANPDSKLPREAMDYLTAKGLISVGDVLR